MEIKFSDVEMKAYKRMLQNAPKYYQAVSANVLNDLAFEMREILQNQISSTMQMRNRGLLRKFTRVEKAKPGPINQQRAIVGTIRDKDFTGWAENEKGGRSERNRQIMLEARGGNKAKQVPTANRIAQMILNPDESYGPTSGQRTLGFLSHLGRRGQWKGLFRLEGLQYKGGIYHLTPGTWQFTSKKTHRTYTMPEFKRVQQEGTPINVRSNAFMQRSNTKLFSTGAMQDRWSKALHTAIDRMVKVHGGEL